MDGLGAFQEFLKSISMLHKAAPMAIDIICPSLLVGFSDKPTEPGMNSKEIAKIQHELVLALGYKKYVVQGGDWGATVSKWIAGYSRALYRYSFKYGFGMATS